VASCVCVAAIVAVDGDTATALTVLRLAAAVMVMVATFELFAPDTAYIAPLPTPVAVTSPVDDTVTLPLATHEMAGVGTCTPPASKVRATSCCVVPFGILVYAGDMVTDATTPTPSNQKFASSG
jgi:hypothetical protein